MTDGSRTIRRREAEKHVGQDNRKGDGMDLPPDGALHMSIVC